MISPAANVRKQPLWPMRRLRNVRCSKLSGIAFPIVRALAGPPKVAVNVSTPMSVLHEYVSLFSCVPKCTKHHKPCLIMSAAVQTRKGHQDTGGEECVPMGQ